MRSENMAKNAGRGYRSSKYLYPIGNQGRRI